jgi:hypothetical protein
VASWGDSGLTARQFAARVGVNPRTLAYWRWRLSSERARPVASTPFVELTSAIVTAAPVDDGVDVLCRGGRAVRVRRDFDPVTLLRVLDALEGR